MISNALALIVGNLDETARDAYWDRVVRQYPEYFRRARQQLGSDQGAERAVRAGLTAIKRGLPGKKARILFDPQGRPLLFWATQEMEKAIVELRSAS